MVRYRTEYYILFFGVFVVSVFFYYYTKSPYDGVSSVVKEGLKNLAL